MIIDIAAILTLLTTFFLSKKYIDLLNFFNPFSYFYWSYFIFCFVALFYRDFYDYSLDISYATAGLTIAGLFFYSLGGVLGCWGQYITEAKLDLYKTIYRSNQQHESDFLVDLVVVITPVACALAFILVTGDILWFSDSFDDERISIRKGMGFLVIPGICSAYVGAIYSGLTYIKDKNLNRAILKILLFSLAAVTYGNRAPAADVMVIGFCFVWIGLFKRIRYYQFLSVAIIGLASIMILGIFRQGLEFNAEVLFKQMLWRPFTNIQNVEWVVTFIPNIHDYFYGESLLIDIAVLAPGYQPNFGTYIKEVMGREFSGGSITLSFIGQAYADFGPVFALVFIGIAGFLFQRVFIAMSNKQFTLPYLIIFSVAAKAMASSGIVSPILYILIPSFMYIFLVEQLKYFSRHRVPSSR